MVLSSLEALPWRELAVDAGADCTGVYGSREHGEAVSGKAPEECAFPHLAATTSTRRSFLALNHAELRTEHGISLQPPCTPAALMVIKPDR